MDKFDPGHQRLGEQLMDTLCLERGGSEAINFHLLQNQSQAPQVLPLQNSERNMFSRQKLSPIDRFDGTKKDSRTEKVEQKLTAIHHRKETVNFVSRRNFFH